jgi:hypothetical protein
MEMGVTPEGAVTYKELEEEYKDVDDFKTQVFNSFPMNSINNGESVHLLSEEDVDSLVSPLSIQKVEPETFWSVSIQIFIPFVIAGFGMVGAGLILDIVQHWAVFVQVPEVFILVPALLGLKGNLEMTLASRLSTQANLGNLDSRQAKWNLAIGNLSLVQVNKLKFNQRFRSGIIYFFISVSGHRSGILGFRCCRHFGVDTRRGI